MELLRKLIHIQSPVGEEFRMKEFILNYTKKNKKSWKKYPKIIEGEDFQDNLIFIFGKPRTAIYVHMDTIGFMVRYDKELIPIGSPLIKENTKLVGSDTKGRIECNLETTHPNYNIAYTFFRELDRGTSLSHRAHFKEKEELVEASYLDNRIGLWIALRLAEILTNGAIVFTCGEEQQGGSAKMLSKYLYDKFNIKQALIADVSWTSNGIIMGNGAIISRRDASIPRKVFFDKIVKIAKEENALFQIEIEQNGNTDGVEIQNSARPIDWCFVGAPALDIHSPVEKIHKIDIFAMFYLYSVLMKKL